MVETIALWYVPHYVVKWVFYQHSTTKSLNGFEHLAYADRLNHLGIPSLELRRLHFDLIFCYKIVFGLVNVRFEDFFVVSLSSQTRGHPYKLFKPRCGSTIRRNFFCRKSYSINVWNFLPSSVNFSSLATFRRSIQDIDFTDFLKLMWFVLIYGYVCYFTYFLMQSMLYRHFLECTCVIVYFRAFCKCALLRLVVLLVVLLSSLVLFYRLWANKWWWWWWCWWWWWWWWWSSRSPIQSSRPRSQPSRSSPFLKLGHKCQGPMIEYDHYQTRIRILYNKRLHYNDSTVYVSIRGRLQKTYNQLNQPIRYAKNSIMLTDSTFFPRTIGLQCLPRDAYV